MNLIDAFEDINKRECFGYSPVSSSTKPAHVANGWFRRLLGKAYDPVLLNKTVVQWTQDVEVNPSEPLLQANPDVFAPFCPESKRQEFTDFRADLKALMGPVGAVNNGNHRSSYNATHCRHLTKDISENSVGAFLYHLLHHDLGSGPSPLVELVLSVLNDASDEVSTVCYPLVQSCQESDVAVGTYPAPQVFARRGKRFASLVLRGLRQGFDRLAAFEKRHGGGLEALRRAVAFGVFAVLLHMPNRHREIAGPAGLTPVLLYFQGRHRTTVYQASHYTYGLARQAIENLYTHHLRKRVVDRIGERPTLKKCEQLIKDVVLKADEDARRAQLGKTFLTYEAQLGRLDGLAEALRDTIFRNLSGTPTDFYRGLGVRVGILKPAGNSATRKFYTLDGVLLEAVLASVAPEGQLSFRDFLGALYDRYGLLTGGRPEDAEILLGSGIGQATVEDLRANAQVFRQQLLALGWARQYADGVLSVQAPEGTQ